MVYVSDEDGLFYAVNARSGEIIWQVQTRVGTAAVGVDGTIYALQVQAPALVAISPEGDIRWQRALNELAPFVNWLLPDDHRLITPLGGVQVSIQCKIVILAARW